MNDSAGMAMGSLWNMKGNPTCVSFLLSGKDKDYTTNSKTCVKILSSVNPWEKNEL
ncbi:hypothetical protein WG904_14345 [Pedobacter sp. Du54]|uniref:hypothetical protein n=1 Tax=Pedobacter anseongensis TaxID=3133439 RepID=UPI0030A8844E